jgi:hypothetical protein
MAGISDLAVLLASMEPVLGEGEYVYVTVPEGRIEDHLSRQALGLFREPEGLTLILSHEIAQAAGLASSGPLRLITLNVHSSLEAVGLTAAVSAALTRENISANVVAAFYHDHIFVGAADAERALEALVSLSATSGRGG